MSDVSPAAQAENLRRTADLVAIVKGGRVSAALELMPAVEQARALSMINQFLSYLEIDPTWFEERLRQDPGRSSLLIEAVRTVAQDEDFEEKAAAYASVVADGFGVDDQVNEARMVVATVGQLKPPAIAALAELDQWSPDRIQIFEGRRPVFECMSERLGAAALGQLEALGLVSRKQWTRTHPARDRGPDTVSLLADVGLTAWGQVIVDALAAGEP